MLGEQKSTCFTVKDLSAAEFISAFAQYLKKNNLIERPKWADYVKTSTGTNAKYLSLRIGSP
jgi:ribosomal protein S19E (S16A)